MLSNRIYDVEINHESGEVFFATDKGLVSYRGTATMGSDEFRDVYVYPNPVRKPILVILLFVVWFLM